MPRRRWTLGAWALIGIVGLAGCTPKSSSPPRDGAVDAGAAEVPAGSAEPQTYDLEIPMVEYRWDPKAGDSSVSAELGGPGFTGEGWETNLKFPARGSAKAVRGGSMTRYMSDWPATLRQTGKDWNSSINYLVADLCYESLLTVHPNTLEHMPKLATHWQISDDKMTYRFRIDPRARWSDGKEITSADVVASYKLRMDPTLLDPSNILTFGKLEEPVAISKYIVEVKAKEENWRNFLYFSGSSVFPAHEVSIKGSEYLDKFQFSYTANSGPYQVRAEDIVRGQSVTLTRRSDWWGEGNPAHVGLWNIERLRFVVVKDPNLVFEKAKKGEIDYFVVPKAQWWAEEIPELDEVKRGLLVPRKFYTDAPVGTSGLSINTRKPPLDDLRIRKALAHLYDRKTMIQKLYFNEYEPLSSYYQGGTYQNTENKLVEYDEVKAVELLEEAGWTAKNDQLVRVKDGKELTFTVTYRTKLSERSLTVFQEACKRAGIRIELQLLTPAAGWKNLRQKEYELFSMAWGALVFPNPETSFLGKLADQVNNNNVTSFKNARVDELCKAYDQEYDVQKRVEIIREIDGIVFNEHPYVLGWYLPSQRILFWNKFGMPEWGGFRTADYDQLLYSWWVDPEKERKLAAAQKDGSSLPPEPCENRFWAAWHAAQRDKRTASRAK
jgi:microcin C transport system substrate-binding protein